MSMSQRVWKGFITRITNTGLKLDTLVHEGGCDVLAHAAEHGDARRMNELLAALPKGYRAEGFKVWVETYSPIRWNGDGEIGLLQQGNKKYTPFKVQEATDNPFWTLASAKEKVAKELSPEALKALIERFVKTVNEADEEGNVYAKDGSLKAVVKGNVVELKAYAERVVKAAA